MHILKNEPETEFSERLGTGGQLEVIQILAFIYHGYSGLCRYWNRRWGGNVGINAGTCHQRRGHQRRDGAANSASDSEAETAVHSARGLQPV